MRTKRQRGRIFGVGYPRGLAAAGASRKRDKNNAKKCDMLDLQTTDGHGLVAWNGDHQAAFKL